MRPDGSDSSAREAAFFDALVDREGEFDPFTEAGWATVRQRFEAMVPLDREVALLDVGCGTGRSFSIYAAHVGRYVAVDLSYAALRAAHRRDPARPWICADALKLPFPDASFDVVAFSSVLHHIPAFEGAAVEGFRVLRPGGIAFAFDPNVLNPAMAVLRHPRSPLYQPAGVSPNERPLAPAALRRVFEIAGFSGIVQRGQSGIEYRTTAVGTVNRVLPLYNRFDRLFERSGLGRWFGTFVMTAGRKDA